MMAKGNLLKLHKLHEPRSVLYMEVMTPWPDFLKQHKRREGEGGVHDPGSAEYTQLQKDCGAR